MNLSSLLSSVANNLSTALPTWNVSEETIEYPIDLLLEVRLGQFNFQYSDMNTTSYVGNIELAFYKEFDSSYTDLVTAIETGLKALPTMNIENTTIGAQSNVIGTVQRPQVGTDNTKSYYIVTVTVPFELLNI